MRRRALATALAVAALAAATATAETRVSARLEPRVVGPGETLQLALEVRGGVFSQMDLEPTFAVSNLEIVGGPARVENLHYANGVTSRSVRLVWQLAPQGLGSATVYDIVVEVGGERYDLPALEAEVVEGSTGGAPPAGRRQQPPWWRLPDPLSEFFEERWPRGRVEPPEVRLVAQVAPRRVVAGEQLLYTLYLYTQTNITRISADALPDFRGFWVEEVPRPDDATTERVELDGEVFWRTALLERVLFPLRPGRYAIAPAEVEVVARTISSSPFSRGLSRSESLTLASGAAVVEVAPLPAPPPALAGRFHGLVGEVSLDARLLPAEVEAGEAATLELTLTGRANLQGVEAPPLPDLPGVAVLPAQEEGGNRIAGRRVEGHRVWRFPLVPERAGSWSVPPLEVAYFDPRSGEYRLAAAPPLVLSARRAAAGGADGRHPIRSAALPADDARGPWARALPWLFALPWLVALAVALVRRREGDEAAAPAGPPAADPRRRLEARLAAAAGRERPRQSAREMEEAWREFLGAAAGVPADLPAASWPRRLGARDAAAGDDMARLLEDLHYLRYAPQLAAVAALRGELVERSTLLARRLANGAGGGGRR